MTRLADRFVLERQLGAGGMARVFLGRDEVLDRPVAVKVLNPLHGNTDIGERFQREGRTAARLAHPNIVQVYDAGKGRLDAHESPYIVMEYVPGGDLKELIDRRGALSGPELARLGGEVCSGLAHAHDRGVIHRDIKPHNILLDENGHAKVTDFGIARALDTSQATLTGAYLGTALYSSPEQLQGQKVTPKSDVYSLGVTLYQAATGEAPFTGGTPIEIASQHVSKAPTPPRERGADVSGDLEALILACLAKSPEDRPTVDEARSRLEAAIPAAGATAVQPEAPAAPAAPPPRTPQTGAERTRASAPASPPPAGPAVRPASVAGAGRRGRGRGILAAVALLAVLAVIGALAAPNLLGGSGDESAQQGNAGQNNEGQGAQDEAGGEANGENGDGSGGDTGGESGGGQNGGSGQGGDASASVSATSESSGNPGQGGAGDSGGSGGGQTGQQGAFSAGAAEQTVQEFYTTTSEGDYDRSAELLSQSWRQDTFPRRAIFESTFAEVERVEFVVGPHAEVSGNTATVTGETQATKTSQIERNQGTWYLVREDGRWKIDGWDVINLSTDPT